jgi:hypothetical protein
LVTVFDSNLQKLVPAVAGVAVKTGNTTLDDGNGNITIGSITAIGGPNIIGVGNGVGSILFNSNQGGSDGAYIEWLPNPGMPNQLNITSDSSAPINVINIVANTTQLSGNLQLAGSINSSLVTTLSGTTAGSVKWSQYMQGQFKAFAAQFLSYENNSTTSQTITFPTPFVNTPVTVTNTTGLTITVTTTTLTIGAPNNTTTYSGIVKVEGF